MIKCKHWSPGQPGFGFCAIGIKHNPQTFFCLYRCNEYQELGLPVGQHTVDQKVTDFVAAHTQLLIEGRVEKEVADYRLTVCTGKNKDNKRVTETCEHYSGDKKKRGDGTCAACGCETWKISEMRMKVYYPMECPVNRFAAMPGRRKIKK